MKAQPIENQNTADDKETLGALIDLMGQLDGGIDSEEFQELKAQMMESGMSTEDLIGLLGNNFAETILNRPIVDVQIQRLTETAIIPTYSHSTDACADIYADEDAVILPGCTVAISTGIALAIPEGFEIHVYARSGLSLKTDLRLANSVGIIDAGYRDEIIMALHNIGKDSVEIKDGDRICQFIILPYPKIEPEYVEDNEDFRQGDRGGGIGSTGI